MWVYLGSVNYNNLTIYILYTCSDKNKILFILYYPYIYIYIYLYIFLYIFLYI